MTANLIIGRLCEREPHEVRADNADRTRAETMAEVRASIARIRLHAALTFRPADPNCTARRRSLDAIASDVKTREGWEI